MDPRYARPASPGSRRLAKPGRSSTGDLIYPPGYDPYYAPVRTSRDSISGPRASAERIIVPRTTARPYRDDIIPSRHLQDDYVVSPRRSTQDSMPVSGRRPLTVVAASDPNRYRPVIMSPAEKPASPYKPRTHEVEPHYILPASSSSSRRDHHRTYSADNSNAAKYLSEGRERLERGGYRSSGIGGGRQGYNLNVPLVRQPKDKDDQDYGYEYTDRKEQMYRDTAPRLRPRRESDGGRRERPLSMTGLEDYPLRSTQVSRTGGPPVSTRGFSKLESTKLDRSGSLRHEYRIPREPDLPPRDYVPTSSRDDADALSRRRSTRAPVALHQDPDNGYSSYREDRKEPRSRHHHSSHRTGSLERGNDDRGLGIREPRDNDSRRDSDERNRRHKDKELEDGSDRDRHHRNGHRTDRTEVDDRDRRTREGRDKHGENKAGEDLALGAAGVAAAGLVAEGVKNRHHRDHESAGDEREYSGRDRRDDPEPGRLTVIPDPSESSSRSGENSDEERRERRRRRRKERESREDEELREETRKGRFDELALPNDDQRRESASYDRGARASTQHVPGSDNPSRRHRRHHHRTSEEASHSESSLDDDGRDPHQHRPSVVRVVSPARDNKPENKPKGILRPPRKKFPEDPAPVREGVAPLKDAGKKGIPPNARWTKIDRKLVNPEALDQGNERYEERIDYVIVLRVLTKEEIEAYAERTQEIRGKRTPLVEDEASAAG